MPDSFEHSRPAAPPAPADTVEAGLQNIAEYGYTIHRGYIDAEMVSRLTERVDEQAELERELGVANLGGTGGPTDLIDYEPGKLPEYCFQSVDFLPNKGRIFIELNMSKIGLAYADGLFGHLPYRVWSNNAVITTRGLAKQMAHSDEGAIPRDMCTRVTMVNIFVSLTDYRKDMGATLFAPGSHRYKTEAWMQNTDHVEFFPAEMKAGDAVLWEGRTWHGGGEHCSDDARKVITTGYSLTGITPQQLYIGSLRDEVFASMSVAEREMHGFRAEAMGYTNRVAPRYQGDPQTNTNRPVKFVPELHRK